MLENANYIQTHALCTCIILYHFKRKKAAMQSIYLPPYRRNPRAANKETPAEICIKMTDHEDTLQSLTNHIW